MRYKNLRTVLIAILGLWVLMGIVLSIKMLIDCNFSSMFQIVINIYTIVGSILIYVIIFMYFMIMKIYGVDNNEEKIIIYTQFKKIICLKSNIFIKETCIGGFNILKINYNDKTKTLFARNHIVRSINNMIKDI